MDPPSKIRAPRSSFLIHIIFVHQRLSCRTCSILPAPQMSQIYFGASHSVEIRPGTHCLILSDCSNAISSTMQGNPKYRERTNRLVCSHLNDIQQFPNVSFVCAALNMADLCTKMGGNLHLFRQFDVSGQCRIGFMSRGECRRAMTQSKSTTPTPVSNDE